MKKNSISAALLCALIAGTGAVRAQTADGKPAVVKIDPSFDALVSPDAKLQMVKTGYGFVEGIVWVQKKDQPGYLLLSDMPANVIFKLTPDGRAVAVPGSQRLHRLRHLARRLHPEQRQRQKRSEIRRVSDDRVERADAGPSKAVC